MLRCIRWVASVLAGLAAVVWGVIWLAQAQPDSRAASLVHAAAGWLAGDPAAMRLGAMGSFSLTDSQGRAVTEQTFRGKWMLVYFGYTYCPDVCPATLQTISNTLDQLNDQDSAKIVPLFITVDPTRDTPGVLADYLALFDKRLVGLTGSAEQLVRTWSVFGVSVHKVRRSAENSFTIDHSARIYLLTPDGKLSISFSAGADEADMVAVISAAVSE